MKLKLKHIAFKLGLLKQSVYTIITGPISAGKISLEDVLLTGEINDSFRVGPWINLKKWTYNNVEFCFRIERFKKNRLEESCLELRRAEAIIVMVDASNKEQIVEYKNTLHALIDVALDKKIPIVLFANKIDKPSAVNEDELCELLGLSRNPEKNKISQDSIPVFMMSLKEKQGINEALDFLSERFTSPIAFEKSSDWPKYGKQHLSIYFN